MPSTKTSYDALPVLQMSHEITWRRMTCSEMGLMLTTLEPDKAVATRQTERNDLKNDFYIFYIFYRASKILEPFDNRRNDLGSVFFRIFR